MSKSWMAMITLGVAFAEPGDSLKAIQGDWLGTLKTGGPDLRLVVHVRGDGATLDSLDQNANGIPVTSISLTGSKINLAVESVRGTYQGVLSEDGLAWKGTWQQGQALPLDFRKVTAASKPSGLEGAWLGDLDTGAMKLRIIFHLADSPAGLTATMDSPDQGAKGIPVTKVTLDGASLGIDMQQIGGKLDAKISADLSTMEGTWTQGGAAMPLVLKRTKDSAELERKRPQNPVKPYPYKEEEVAYPNKTAHITLAGTLTIPEGKGPFPAVILITGSGPQDRDESLLGHKPFLVLSDYLTRRGIAVLRTDDRGVAKSGGSFATATTADFATDTEAGLAYLKTRPEIASHRIGLIGHSEGGIIAPMVASRNPDVAFIVLMAGTGVAGDEILAAQSLLISEAAGLAHDVAEKNAAEERRLLAMVKNESDVAAIEKKLRDSAAGKIPPAQLDAQIKQLTSPWMRYFIAYDPAPALAKVKCPVLAINGEKDLQVPPKLNLPVIRKALEAGGNKHFEIVELPGLNHLFQTAKTGAPGEYAEIEETISPRALATMGDWILKR